jgi:hypothetical protein
MLYPIILTASLFFDSHAVKIMNGRSCVINMNKTYEKVRALTNVKMFLCLSVLFILFHFTISVTVGFTETVKVTIAQTNNLNGSLFDSGYSE